MHLSAITMFLFATLITYRSALKGVYTDRCCLDGKLGNVITPIKNGLNNEAMLLMI